MNAYLVTYAISNRSPSLIFAENIFDVAERNKAAIKIEELDCWIVPGQGGKLP